MHPVTQDIIAQLDDYTTLFLNPVEVGNTLIENDIHLGFIETTSSIYLTMQVFSQSFIGAFIGTLNEIDSTMLNRVAEYSADYANLSEYSVKNINGTTYIVSSYEADNKSQICVYITFFKGNEIVFEGVTANGEMQPDILQNIETVIANCTISEK